ncbi:tumor necrosis factor ligand superfamily member 11-like isoform X1 [Sardina pilchardus]|uniref:tumor necrosis factor ligand superfamily member 11-like isoform X1 n=2 Tax=Sardina pilchardus TaxID=27697 RepID=UPI002E12191A
MKNSLASRLQANSPASVPKVIIILVGLLQVVTCVVVVLHLKGHIKAHGADKSPVQAEPLVELREMQQLRSLKRSRHRTPVAHLPINPSSTHTEREVRATMIHWNAEQGYLFQFGYHDGRILVRKPGLYYVYTKTCFRYYDELEPGLTSHPRGYPSDRRLAATASPVQLIQYVFHERPSRGAPPRPTVIMKSGSTQHWRVGGYHMYCQQQGATVALRTGDGLFVRVSNSWMLDPEAEGSYFGAFRISH